MIVMSHGKQIKKFNFIFLKFLISELNLIYFVLFNFFSKKKNNNLFGCTFKKFYFLKLTMSFFTNKDF